LRTGRPTRAIGEPRAAAGAASRTSRLCAASCATHSPTDPHLVFAAWSDAVYAFDLRTGDVLLREAATSFTGGADEVNGLSVSADGVALVGGDDDGMLLVWGSRAGERQLRIAEAHTSVVSAVICHPRHALRAYSSGLDGRICAWSLPDGSGGGGKGKKGARGAAKPLWVCALLDEAAVGAAASNQLLNPRLAHAIALDGAGDLLAAALGDGSVEVRSAASGEQLARSSDEMAHADSACQVGFLPTGAAGDGGTTMWSAGNDRLLRVWSLAAAGGGTASASKKGSGRSPVALSPVLDVRLPHKPNWVTAVSTRTRGLCVADVDTGTLSLYVIS
jgi:WD40 repeat protein